MRESVNLTRNSETEEDLATFILDQWTTWDNYRGPVKQRWQEIEAYKYATDTNNSIMGTNGFDHSTHIPVLASIAEDLEAIMAQTTTPHEDWFEFQPEDKKSASYDSRRKVTAYIKNRHKVSKFNKTKRKLDSDFVTYGSCFAMVKFEDESTDESVGYIGPKVYRISPYDICFNPTAEDFENTPKIIRSMEEVGFLYTMLEKGLGNEAAIREILDNREAGTANMRQHEKDQQYVPQGFSNYDSYMTSGYVEILWFYGDIYNPETQSMMRNRKMAAVEGKYLILNEDIKTPTGKPFIFKATFKDTPDNLWGMGPLDNLVGLNYQINHRENAKNDALDKLINPDIVKAGDVEEIYDEETGRIEYLAPEGGGVQELAINTQFFQFGLETDRLEAVSRQAARLPNDVVGFRTPGEKTLGEVSSLTEGAMRGFIHKAKSYEEFLESILEAELVLSAQNLSSLIQVPGQVENGIIPFLDITKQDLNVTGSLKARGAQRFARKNQILANMTQIASTGIMQFVAPHISGKNMANLVAEMLEVESSQVFEEFAAIDEQAEGQMRMQQNEQVMAGQSAQPTLQEEIINQELDQ